MDPFWRYPSEIAWSCLPAQAKRLKASPDFQVVGAYPPDQEVDIQRLAPTKDLLRKIRALATPTNDP